MTAGAVARHLWRAWCLLVCAWAALLVVAGLMVWLGLGRDYGLVAVAFLLAPGRVIQHLR